MRCLGALMDLGYIVTVRDCDLYLRQTKPGEPTAQALSLIAELREQKAEALEYLNLLWPPESAESEAKFRPGAPRLYPLLHQMVWTPQGEGKLCQVGAANAAVALQASPDKMVFVPWLEVRPLVTRQRRRQRPQPPSPDAVSGRSDDPGVASKVNATEALWPR